MSGATVSLAGAPRVTASLVATLAFFAGGLVSTPLLLHQLQGGAS